MNYVEIRLLESDGIPPETIMSKVLGQLHYCLVTAKAKSASLNVGINFPRYVEPSRTKAGTLGGAVRVFAKTAEDLKSLNLAKFMEEIDDYIKIMSIKEVPEAHTFVRASRVQLHSNLDKLARRFAKRHSVSIEEAKSKYSGATLKTSNLPYAWLKSASSNNQFMLVVRQETADTSNLGMFGSYGLSPEATTPIW